MIRSFGVVGLHHRWLAHIHRRQNQVILEVFTHLCSNGICPRARETARKKEMWRGDRFCRMVKPRISLTETVLFVIKEIVFEWSRRKDPRCSTDPPKQNRKEMNRT